MSVLARRSLRVARLGLLLAIAAGPARASAQASPYVPLDDPAYAYIDALAVRGGLPGLPLLARPYTVAAVERALERGAASGSAAPGAYLQVALRRRLARFAPAVPADTGVQRPMRVVLGIEGRVTAQSSARRELMLPDHSSGVHPGLSVRADAAGGSIAAGFRIIGDDRLNRDPEFGGYQDGPVAGRVEDAYVAGQWRYGELFVGRTSRNWGLPQRTGLQIGDYTYSFDHLHGRLGTDRLHVATILARLDDTPGLYAPRVHRYLSVHRFAGQWRSLEAAVSETYVYSGEGRGFEPTLMNPFVPFLVTHYNDTLAGNVSFAGELLWRSPIGVLGAQLLVDDFQFERGDVGDDEPPSYGFVLSAEGLPLWGAHRWFLSYDRLSSLVYRTPEFAENYVSRGVALGHGFSDYDELRAGIDAGVPLPMTVRLYGAYRRQGEGDYRAPFPPPEAYATTPGFLIGSVGRTVRAGIRLHGEAAPGMLINGDVGVNSVRDVGGAYGPVRSGFTGRVVLRLEPGFLVRVLALH